MKKNPTTENYNRKNMKKTIKLDKRQKKKIFGLILLMAVTATLHLHELFIQHVFFLVWSIVMMSPFYYLILSEIKRTIEDEDYIHGWII